MTNGDDDSTAMTPAAIGPRVVAYAIDLTFVTIALCVASALFGFLVGLLFSGGRSPFAPDLSSPMGFRYDPSALAGSLLLIVLLLFLFAFVLVSIFHGYFIWFEFRREGRTPGKRWLGLRVVDAETGGPITRRQAVVRDLMRYIDVGLLLPGLIAILADRPRGRRFGDRVAATRVVRDATRNVKDPTPP